MRPPPSSCQLALSLLSAAGAGAAAADDSDSVTDAMSDSDDEEDSDDGDDWSDGSDFEPGARQAAVEGGLGGAGQAKSCMPWGCLQCALPMPLPPHPSHTLKHPLLMCFWFCCLPMCRRCGSAKAAEEAIQPPPPSQAGHPLGPLQP